MRLIAERNLYVNNTKKDGRFIGHHSNPVYVNLPVVILMMSLIRLSGCRSIPDELADPDPTIDD